MQDDGPLLAKATRIERIKLVDLRGRPILVLGRDLLVDGVAVVPGVDEVVGDRLQA